MTGAVLDKFVSTMTDILQSAKDFTLEQAPDVLKQIIVWKRGEETASFLFFALLGVASVVFFYRVYRQASLAIAVVRAKPGADRYMKGYDWDDYGSFVVACYVLPVGGLISFIGVFNGFSDMLQVWLAPKIYLIEYFAHFVTKGGCAK
jgi:hypothetical protein